MSRPVLTRDHIRQVDRDAVARYAIPSIILMENAARQVADNAGEMLDRVAGLRYVRDSRVLVLCGGGNNGGDGLAAARHLHNRNVGVTIALLKSPGQYTGDAKINLDICLAMKLKIVEAASDPLKTLTSLGPQHLILDALLGTGLTGPVQPPMTDAIQWINQQHAPVLAIDIPSGLDCDTGKPLGSAVMARRTVTFVAMKLGFTQPGVAEYTGEVRVADIGAPRELIESLCQPPT